jgi:D-glycero-D-manno-heptose 1,7-bisphosphate phosphatase
MTHRAVFLDRDGVLNQALLQDGKPFPPARVEEFKILPGVEEACRRLKASGFLLIVATNQPDVGRGTLKREVIEAIHTHMCRLLPIDRVEISFAAGTEQPPDEYRKPRPGMLRRAAGELSIDLAKSFMVGDRWRDIDCGHAAGCTTILIDYGYTEALRQQPHYRVKSLLEAADIILGLEHKGAL